MNLASLLTRLLHIRRNALTLATRLIVFAGVMCLRSRTLKSRIVLPVLFFIVAISSVFLLASSASNRREAASSQVPSSQHDSTKVTHLNLPLSFERNDGQSNEQVRFISQGDGYQLFLTNDEAVLCLRSANSKEGSGKKEEDGYRVVRMRVVGAQNTQSKGETELSGKVNYFIGNDPAKWRTDVPLFAKVRYHEIYDGINLVYYGNQRQLEYDFEVAPGSDPRQIKLQFTGTDKIKLDKADGSLVLEMDGRDVRFKKPVIYQQQKDGNRSEVKGAYRIRKDVVSFEVGAFDRTQPLIIDPILSYSTYLGGAQNDNGWGIAVDQSGSAYVSGQTGSFAFPTAGVNFIPNDNSTGHAFVTKLDPSGSSLVYSTLIGGSSDDRAFAIAVAAGSAHITGITSSNNFPTLNPIRANHSLLKSNSGDSWTASNVGIANLPIYDIAVNPISPNIVYAASASGNGVYKSTDGGATWSGLNTGVNFVQSIAIDPQTPTTIYGAARGPFFGVIKSIDGGTTWTQTTLNSAGVAVAIDPVTPSTVYASTFSGIFKSTNSGGTWLPANTGITNSGLPVVVVDPGNTSIVYAAGSTGVWKTTNGGSNWTLMNSGLTSAAVNALALDPTSSTTLYAGTFGGVFKSTNSGGTWNPMNTGLTSLVITSLLVDPASTVYAGAAGSRIFKSTNGGSNWTNVYSGLSGFSGPSIEALARGTNGSLFAGVETRNSIDNEAFVTKLNAAGNALVFSTYLGGTGSDQGNGIAVVSNGEVVVAGATAATDFPLANPRQSSLQGIGDGFVSKLNSSGSSLIYSTYLGGQFFETATAVAVDASGSAYVTGGTGSPNFPTTPGALQTTQTGNDAFVTKLNSSGSSFVYSTFLGGNDTDTGFGIAVDSSGNAYVTGSTGSTNFPTVNPFQSSNGGFNTDAFVSKLNSTGTGLLYSTYLGGSLSETGRGIAIDTNGNAYLTGTTSSGDFPVTAGALRYRSTLYKTSTGGLSWGNENYGLLGTVNWIAVHPTSPNLVYAATNKGVFRSQNGGRNWSASNSGLTDLLVLVLAIDPTNPSIIYAGTSEQGIFKSTNGGTSWSPANGNLLPSHVIFVRAIAIDPVNSGTVYVSTQAAAIKTIDGGLNWTEFPLGGFSSFAINPQNTQQIYGSINASPGGVLKSDNGGGSWTTVNTGLTSPIVRRLAIDPLNPTTIYAGTDDGLFKSVNGGGIWTPSLNLGFVTAIVIDPLTPATVYASAFSNNGGVFKTTNGGSSWLPVVNGLPSATGILAIDPVNPSNVFTVSTLTQDFDAFVSKLNPSGNGLSYSTFLGGQTGSNGANDSGSAIAVDTLGSAYVAGVAQATNFPVTPDAFQPVSHGFDDTFIAKLSNAFSIAGIVTDAGSTPQSNVKITLTGSSTGSFTTSGDGAYEFPNLTPGGTFTVGATKSGFTATPASQTFANLNANQTVNFTISPSATPFHTISGQIVILESGDPLVGAKVALTGSQTEFTTTDSNGNYSFSAPAGGNYTITPTLLGFTVVPPTNTVNNLNANTTLNFQSLRLAFSVTNANDHGAGSLRQAVLDANATLGTDRISFNIPGGGVHTINLMSPLPTVTDPVTIDGSTQPGFSGSPLIEINGAGVGVAVHGITITAGNSVVRSLVINRFAQSGISLEGPGNNRIEGNIIGLDPTGSIKQPNKGNGINVSGGEVNIIGGTSAAQRNIISGNNANGIGAAAIGTVIQGNFIGTNSAGTIGLGNGDHGIILSNILGISPSNDVVGGSSPGARNLISGNGRNGIEVLTNGTVVQGNIIGTDISGTAKLPNAIGINIQGNSCTIGGTTAAERNVVSGNGTGINVSIVSNQPLNATITGNYVGVDPTGTIKVGNGQGISVSGAATIGTLFPGAGNVISGNDGPGIQINCCNPGSAVVQGNLIGTNAAGDKALGNDIGISIQSSFNVIGGSQPEGTNVISGNQTGIAVGGQSSATSNQIAGNFIGVNKDLQPLRNAGVGIRLDDAMNNTIGGDFPAEANVIRFNGAGITVSGSSINNVIKGNAISSNVGLGIDLNFDGKVEPNDPGDTDNGPNRLQNFPVIIRGFSNGLDGIRIDGSLNSTPSTQFRLDFYGNAACDSSGNGEGAIPVGSTQVSTDATGLANFSIGISGALDFHRAITATATDPQGNTSEFSPCNATLTIGDFEFSAADFNALEDVGSAVVRVRRTGGNVGTGITVHYSSGGGTATPGVDYTPVSGTLTFNAGETEKIINVPIVNDGVTEPAETVELTLSFDSPGDVEILGAHYQTTLHILDAGTPLSLLIDGQAFEGYEEGNFGIRNTNIPVHLNAQTSRTVSVDYNVSAGNATANVDFIPVAGTLTFTPGTESKDIVVPFIGDVLDENTETINLQLSNPVNASLLISGVFVNILDDDPLPLIAVTDVSVVEANGAKAVFSVSLSAPSARSVLVNFATANGSAVAGSDYTSTSGGLTFSPGETLKQVEVPILTDGDVETDETFVLNLSAPLRGTIIDGQGTGTIIDASSTAPLVQFSTASVTVNENEGQAQILVTRTGNTTAPASVNYQTLSQTANDRTDYTTAMGTLTFGVGVTSQSFNVLLTNDTLFEPTETLHLVLSNPSGASLGGPSVIPLNIISNDITDTPSPVRDSAFNTSFFVRQHYHDFLNREPDPAGLAFWINEIDSCGNAQCREVKKINVSAAFFLSIEFQETGYLVYRTYRAAYGTTESPNVIPSVPIIRFNEFLPDSQRIGHDIQVGVGNWEQQLENNKTAHFLDFVQRQRFVTAFPLSMTPAEFVDKLNTKSGGVLSQAERDQLVAELTAAPNVTQGRASVVRKVAEDPTMNANERNRAFVLMQYYGYLRRNPDDPQDTDFRGWEFWLNKLILFNGNFVEAELVKAFITSDEYINRFGK